MQRYFRLYRRLLTMNLMKALMYRGNLWLAFSLTALESVTLFLVVTILFQHITTIRGWSYEDNIVLSGVFLLTLGIGWITYRGGLRDLDIIINRGDLDAMLTKPIDPQFLATIHRIDIEDTGRAVVGLVLIGYGLVTGGSLSHPLFTIPLFLFTFFCGQVVLYSIHLAIKTISFKSIEGWAVESLHWRFHDLAKYPTDIYTGTLRIIYTFVLPLAFIATVPAKALVGGLSVWLVIGSLVAAIASFILSRFIWQHALRGYTSASS